MRTTLKFGIRCTKVLLALVTIVSFIFADARGLGSRGSIRISKSSSRRSSSYSSGYRSGHTSSSDHASNTGFDKSFSNRNNYGRSSSAIDDINFLHELFSRYSKSIHTEGISLSNSGEHYPYPPVKTSAPGSGSASLLDILSHLSHNTHTAPSYRQLSFSDNENVLFHIKSLLEEDKTIAEKASTTSTQPFSEDILIQTNQSVPETVAIYEKTGPEPVTTWTIATKSSGSAPDPPEQLPQNSVICKPLLAQTTDVRQVTCFPGFPVSPPPTITIKKPSEIDSFSNPLETIKKSLRNNICIEDSDNGMSSIFSSICKQITDCSIFDDC